MENQEQFNTIENNIQHITGYVNSLEKWECWGFWKVKKDGKVRD